MFQRSDGIVDFDAELCIGCKACMQACPYDAIYIDPDSHTAAKCHYCAHRTEIGLEPACVVVCPEQAIISGDIDDPQSSISQLLYSHEVTVRRPEKETHPKVFYIEGSDVSLRPSLPEELPYTFMASDVVGRSGGNVAESAPRSTRGSPPVNYEAQLESETVSESAINIAGRISEHMVQVAYNAQHAVPWDWQVPAYLVTKGIGAGLLLMLVVSTAMGLIQFDQRSAIVTGFVALAFIAMTAWLLRDDLARPERFLSVLLRPQWRSWLTRGAYLLVGFSVVTGIWWVADIAAYMGLLSDIVVSWFRVIALWIGSPLAVGVVIYSGFLFAQAEGRDLWQSPLLVPHLLTQSVISGGAVMIMLSVAGGVTPSHGELGRTALLLVLPLNIVILCLGKFGINNTSDASVRAMKEITHGRYKMAFWVGAVCVGHVLPLGLLNYHGSLTEIVSSLAVVAGLYCYEYAFVMAPQEIPNS